jgi:hypothetical protein
MRSRSSGLPVPENAVLDQSSSLLFSFQGRCPCEGKSTYQVLILRSVPLPDCRPLLMGLCLQFLFVSAFGQAGPNPGGGLECSVSAPVGQPGIENEWSRRARPIPCAQPDAIDLRPDLRIGSNFATFGDDGAETIPALPQRLPNITGIEGGHDAPATVAVNARFSLGLAEVPGMRFSAKNRGIITTVGGLLPSTERRLRTIFRTSPFHSFTKSSC